MTEHAPPDHPARPALRAARSQLVELTLLRLRSFWREPGAIFWTFGFPLALTVVLGIAFREQPKSAIPVGIAVAPSGARCQWSGALAGDPRFKTFELHTDDATQKALRSGTIALGLGADCSYEFDPDRPESRGVRAIVDEALQRAAGRRDALAPRDVIVRAPGARYIDFLVPGLIGSNIMSSGMWGIGYVLVEMRNKRLIKRMVATPMRKSEFLLSFVLMRLLFVVIELAVLIAFGHYVFGVPVRGSLALASGLSLLGSLAFCGLGLLCGSRATNMATVNGLINSVIMPMFLGSGVFFSVARFPGWAQPFLRVLPLTALNDGLRAVMLDGAGLVAVLPQLGLMAAVAIATFGISLRIFRWR